MAADFSLARLDVGQYDVFAVASAAYWRTRQPLVRDFFAHLTALGSRGFLATKEPTVCVEATATLGIGCVVSQHFSRDGALSKERWFVMMSLLRRGSRIAYAGLDVRFLQPLSRYYAVSSRADLAFEGTFNEEKGRIGDFTPDVALAHPRARAVAWLQNVVHALRGRSLDGLPDHLQDNTLLRFNLMGPAEQDALKDCLLSALYNRTVALRKYQLAHLSALAMAGKRVAGRVVNASTLANCASSPSRIRRLYADQCRGGGVVSTYGLPPLESSVEDAGGGRLVRTPWLTVHLSNRVAIRSGVHPCKRCLTAAESRRTLALHCLTKQPECLNITTCACGR